MPDVIRDMSLGQLVKQLAALLQKREVALPFKNQEPWHLLFYELSKLPPNPGKPEFLNELVFDWDAPQPKCQELSDFLQALHFTANVSARNPRFDVINVDPDVADRWSQPLDPGNRELEQFLDTAVELACKEFTG
ncbi:MAG: hypothetical protein IIA72_15345 [Proteobacteria bacterium]|nr:hypothetical protein [Pseudomonadota bacterium]